MGPRARTVTRERERRRASSIVRCRSVVDRGCLDATRRRDDGKEDDDGWEGEKMIDYGATERGLCLSRRMTRGDERAVVIRGREGWRGRGVRTDDIVCV